MAQSSELEQYSQRVQKALRTINLELLESSIKLLSETFNNGNNVFVFGNGGSSALASHFVTDLIKSGEKKTLTYKAYSLVDNSALITAISNDYDFFEIFSRQLKTYGKPGDLVFAISSSGNSKNILQALEMSKLKQLKSISLTGFEGGVASKLSDFALVTQTQYGDYGVVEDSHSIICHFISQAL